MRTAFVFPGQGSHRPETVTAWAEHPRRDVFEVVGRAVGVDLLEVGEDPDIGGRTAAAQPTILAASLAAYEALLAEGCEPSVVAGHSLGEVTAAVAAGVFTLEDGAELVAERGRAMAAACASSPGKMAVVLKLGPDDLLHVVGQVPQAVIANENAPGQTVVSGTPAAVDRVAELARERGGRVLPLEVEGAFHSPAMTPAVVRLEATLRRLPSTNPVLPLVSGVSGNVLGSDVAIRRALVEGLLAPVRWVAVQQRLAELGVELLVEVGPGGVLAGLAKRTLPHIRTLAVATPDDASSFAERAAELVGQGAER